MDMHKCKLCVLLGLALLAHSCSLDDLTGTLNGVEEEYVITDRNYGTQHMDEPYASVAAYYEIGANDEGVTAIEFFPDGSCQVLYDGHRYENYREAFTYANGEYSLSSRGWTLSGDLLYISRYNVTETASAKAISGGLPGNALTQKLCHVWEVKKVLVKLYNSETNKLVYTYSISNKEMLSDFPHILVFTRAGHFYRYDSEGWNEVYDDWRWANIGEQKLFYEGHEEEALFSDNRLYLTAKAPEKYADEEEDGDLSFYGTALYQLEPVASFNP